MLTTGQPGHFITALSGLELDFDGLTKVQYKSFLSSFLQRKGLPKNVLDPIFHQA
jgi:hypothetical protein